MLTDENMAAERVRSFRHVGSLMRSKSEGTLIDLSDNASTSDHMNGKNPILNDFKFSSLLVNRLPD